MNILVIGSGGREHAICSALSRSPRVEKLYCAGGNAGIASVAECMDIKDDQVERLVEFANWNKVDITFVGGETPLAMGIVDEFERRSMRIIGPRRDAARLESSKAFAKEFMARHGVPTAMHITAGSPETAVSILTGGSLGGPDVPVVVKADGLAAGKGVVVAANRAHAIEAVAGMAALVGESAAEKIVLEECLFGREVSLLAFVSGEDYSLMPATRDHKRIGEGDTGPNTGGMGTITDASLLTAKQLREIEDTIIRPTLRGCVGEGLSFRGILFLGLMMTESGPQVLEYNIRFGDPETQAILVRLKTDLLDICEAMLDGTLGDLDIKWREGSSACIVLAAENYPARPRTGDAIEGLDDAAAIPGVEVFHAGTATVDGAIVTAGGRVLGVTAESSTLDQALATAYAAADKISWPGMQFRRDIGK